VYPPGTCLIMSCFSGTAHYISLGATVINQLQREPRSLISCNLLNTFAIFEEFLCFDLSFKQVQFMIININLKKMYVQSIHTTCYNRSKGLRHC